MSTQHVPIFLDDLINEVGNQTLQKLGVNIFNLNTYNSYNSSIEGSLNVFDTYDTHKGNKKGYHGTAFEELQAGHHNVQDGLKNKSRETITTDRISDDESKNKFSRREPFKKNDPVTDRVTLDSHGNIIATYQDKVVLRTEDLMQDRYLENDYITVPSDDYEIHINKLQKMAQNAKDEKVRDKAKLFLSKLQKGNFTREEAMNPRFTAIKQQVKQTANNIGQTAFSDGVNMALSTLASGFVAEVRLYYSGKSTETLWEHMYRLFTKTLEDFKQGISRGAGFAGVEIVISTISTLFKSMFSNIKMIWGSLRGSFKSIYNGIYDYIKGKIKTKADLFKIILKSLASAIGVFGIAIIETKLSGFVGSILAGAISIIIGSFIVVSIPKMVDYLISLFNPASIAIKKMNEIIELCDRELTLIIEQHQELEAKINQVFIDRSSELNMSFESLYTSISNKDIKASFSSFFNINKLYGKKLSWGNKEELSKFLESDDTLEL